MSQEAESAVLSGLMFDNAAYWRVADRLAEADFAHGGNRTLFRLVGHQVKSGLPADAVTLTDLCPELAPYIVEIARNAYTAASITHHADVVRKAAERRRLVEAGKRIQDCQDYEDALNVLSLVRPAQARAVKSVKDGLSEMVEALQRRYDADGSVSGVPTSLESLDTLTSGWQPGNLIVIAARPGMGKSAMALQCAIAAGRTFYSSLEMTAGELVERAVSNVGAIPHRWLRFPTHDDTPDYASSRVLEASKLVAQLPLLIDDSPAMSADAIFSRIRQAHLMEPLKLAIIDHLGLITRPGKHDPSELGLITAGAKQLAKALGIPVILLCQLNRGVEQRPNKRPTLSDLRDSGRIEEDADVVIGLYRDEFYNRDPRNALAGYLEAIVLKNRSGELGTAWARSLLSRMTLESCNEPELGSAEPTGNANSKLGFQARSSQGRKPRAVS